MFGELTASRLGFAAGDCSAEPAASPVVAQQEQSAPDAQFAVNQTWNTHELEKLRVVMRAHFGREARVWLTESLVFETRYFENLIYIEACLPPYWLDKLVNATVDLRVAIGHKKTHLLIREDQKHTPFFRLAKQHGCRIN